MRLSAFKVLSFDCYGTLIDWETGLRAALEPWLRRHGNPTDADAVVALFGRCEAAQQAETPRMPYPRLLGCVLRRIGRGLGVPVTDTDADAFGASVTDWPAFPDSPAALSGLGRSCKLVILSNVDRRSFAASNAKLGVTFDAVCTAEDIGAYKPNPRTFTYLLKVVAGLGFGKSDILHTAQSLFHDHVPAKAIGLATCWIDRDAGRAGGATRPPDIAVRPDFRFETLAAMAEARRRESAR